MADPVTTSGNLSGRRIRGYALGDRVGIGGFGSVYKAHQDVVERDVVVKVIRSKFVNQPEFVRRFEAEAKIVARLEHAYIVPLYDYWRDPSGAYLVMRYLRGGSLRSRMDKAGPIPLKTLVKYLNQLVSALSVAHRQGVIHRDLKPENILLDEYDYAYLSDFGIAVDLVRFTDTVDNLPYGSPEYISPEQITSGKVTPQADVYSLGIMLYEVLTNTNPYQGVTTQSLLKQHLEAPIPSVLSKRPDLPPTLDQVIWRATAKNPDARYKDVMTLGRAFEKAVTPFLDGTANPIVRVYSGQMGNQPLGSGTAQLFPNAGEDSFKTGKLFDNTRDPNATGYIERPTDVDQYATGPIDRSGFASDDALQTGKIRKDDDPNQTGLINFDQPFTAYPDFEESQTSDLSQEFSGFRAFPQNDAIEAEPLPPAEIRNPYKGLRAFEEGDENDFFGREKQVAGLLKQLSDGKDFITLIGPSGSGKSSLVRAGLFPSLRIGRVIGSEEWFIVDMVPGKDPFVALGDALLRIAMRQTRDLDSVLRDEDADLTEIAALLLKDPDAQILLFIDQFEEVFTLASEEDRSAFLRLIQRTVANESNSFRLIMTLRADYYDRPLQYPEFGALVRENTEVVLPLTEAELEAVIVRPAEKVGLVIEGGLVEAIIEEIGDQPGAMPLMQYAMSELFNRKQGHVISLQAYEEIGKIKGALGERAAEIYETLPPQRRELAKQLFLRLVAVNANAATRRRIVWTQAFDGITNRDDMQIVIDTFANYRLLTLDRDPETRLPTIEIAHEALITAWIRLQDWINQNRSDLQQLKVLSEAAYDWAQNGRGDDLLARGGRLVSFETLLETTALTFGEVEQDFITASIHMRERLERRSRMITAALTIFSIVTLVLAIFAFNSSNEAVRQRDVAARQAELARSRELAALAQGELETANDRSILLSVEALALSDTFEARNALLSSIQQNPFLASYLPGHENVVRTVAYNPAGNRIATAGQENRIRIFDADTHTLLHDDLTGHTDAINAIGFSPDNTRLVSASSDGSVRLWDAESGELLQTWTTHEADVRTVAFSPAGDVVASGDVNGTLIIRDVASGELIQEIPDAHEDSIYALIFTPDGNTLITGGGDNAVRFWNTSNWEAESDPIVEHSNWVRALSVTPDSSVLASTGNDNTIILWDIANQQALQTVQTGHQGTTEAIHFSPDARFLVTTAADAQIRIWNTSTFELVLAPLTVHRDRVWGLDFHPQRFAFVTGSHDAQVILWEVALPARPGIERIDTDIKITAMDLNLEANVLAAAGILVDAESGEDIGVVVQLYDAQTNEVQHTLLDSPGLIQDIALSPDGSLLVAAIADDDATILIWNTQTGMAEGTLRGHESFAASVAFHPIQPNTLYSSDAVGEIIQWDVASGEQVGSTIQAQSDGVLQMAVSPDGSILAAAGRDGTVMLFDTQTREAIGAGIDLHRDAINALVFSGDSQLLITGSRDSRVIIWDIAANERLFPPFSHPDWVLDVSITADDGMLATASRDGAVRLWDLERGLQLGEELIGHGAQVTGVVFNDVEQRLLSASEDRSIIVWETNDSAWQATACEIANRDFSMDERRQFFADAAVQSACGSG